jgi:hypothetical protein
VENFKSKEDFELFISMFREILLTINPEEAQRILDKLEEYAKD